MNKDIGGPAFPSEYFYDDHTGTELLPSYGMSLRDYFAAKAMQGMIQRFEANEGLLAITSYKVADAMLKAREQ